MNASHALAPGQAQQAAQAMRAQDEAADFAGLECLPATHAAIHFIEKSQLFESDVLCLLYAIQRQIERKGDAYQPQWQTVCDELAGIQLLLDDQLIEDHAICASAERLAGI
jgi:hypothetical protein